MSRLARGGLIGVVLILVSVAGAVLAPSEVDGLVDWLAPRIALVGAVAASVWATRRWREADDGLRQFTTYRTTIGSQTADAAFWVCRHTCDRQRVPASWCVGILLFVLVLPITGALLGGAANLKDHGLAVGLTALVWGVVTELPQQRLRNREYEQQTVSDRDRKIVLAWTVLLAVVEIAAFLAMTSTTGHSSTVTAVLFSVALVGMADVLTQITSVFVGAADGYPLTKIEAASTSSPGS